MGKIASPSCTARAAWCSSVCRSWWYSSSQKTARPCLIVAMILWREDAEIHNAILLSLLSPFVVTEGFHLEEETKRFPQVPASWSGISKNLNRSCMENPPMETITSIVIYFLLVSIIPLSNRHYGVDQNLHGHDEREMNRDKKWKTRSVLAQNIHCVKYSMQSLYQT